MKVIIITFSILLTSFISRAQHGFIEVSVNEGPNYTIKLLREGLVCRGQVQENDQALTRIVFFPYDSLDQNQVSEIQQFIKATNFLSKTTKAPANAVTYSDHGVMRMSFEDIDESLCHSFIYYSCESNVDALIVMLNDLVPAAFKSGCYLIPKCK